MRALVLRDFYDIAVEERPEPQPRPGEVVVAVIATGICGSDFHGYSGENGRRHPGQVMGHETVGRIDELGSGVAELAVGQLVTVNPVMSCHICPACLVRSSGALGGSCLASHQRSRRPLPTGLQYRPRTSCRYGTTCRRSWGRWWSPWQSVTTRYAAVCHARKIECWSLAADL
jgi:NADPH:quinone reductase-like Zn-dependent oxidoreductase